MESAFGSYDWLEAKRFCQQAADLVREAREKLHAAHALFATDTDRATSEEDAERVAELGRDAGELWVNAAELGRL